MLRRSPGRLGPKSFGNGWPGMMVEFEDQLEEQARLEHARDRDAELRRRMRAPTSVELDKAAEALAWGMLYLADQPLRRDAVQLWAWCKANDRKLDPVLRKRRAAAGAMIVARYGPGAHSPALRKEVMPNRVMNASYCDYLRKHAATLLAQALNSREISIR